MSTRHTTPRQLLIGLMTVWHSITSAEEGTPAPASITAAQLDRIGQRVWLNECDRSLKDLVAWNAGEEFASLGIGHFIWYPTAAKGPYAESFPALLRFLQSRGQRLPEWLTPDTLCPWPDHASFVRIEASDSRIAALRLFLKDTLSHQAAYLAQRSADALPKMLAACEPDQRSAIRTVYQELATTELGLYCLIDYTNFKGEGVKPEERYHGQGWGLLQVLLETQATLPSSTSMTAAFSDAARRVLRLRVQNSDPKRNEKRWLEGWLNRCDSYGRPLADRH